MGPWPVMQCMRGELVSVLVWVLMMRERGVLRREEEVVGEERRGEPVEGSVAMMMEDPPEEGVEEGSCGCDGFRVGAAVSAAV